MRSEKGREYSRVEEEEGGVDDDDNVVVDSVAAADEIDSVLLAVVDSNRTKLLRDDKWLVRR